jgi:hypothetical protein
MHEWDRDRRTDMSGIQSQKAVQKRIAIQAGSGGPTIMAIPFCEHPYRLFRLDSN